MSRNRSKRKLITESSDNEDLQDFREDAQNKKKHNGERQSQTRTTRSEVVLEDCLNPRVVIARLTESDVAKFSRKELVNGVIGGDIRAEINGDDKRLKNDMPKETSCATEEENHIGTNDSECKETAELPEKEDLGCDVPEATVLHDMSSDTENIMNALHREMQAQRTRKPSDVSTNATHNIFCNTEGEIRMNKTPRLILKRLSQKEISSFTRNCEQCKKLSKCGRNVCSRNRVRKNKTTKPDAKKNDKTNLEDHVVASGSTDFDSTDSEIDFETRERRKRMTSTKRKRNTTKNEEKDEKIVISDDEVKDETYTISSDDDGGEEDVKASLSKRKVVDENLHQRTDARNGHMSTRKIHGNSNGTNSIIIGDERNNKRNHEVIVIPDSSSCEVEELPGKKTSLDSEILAEKKTDCRKSAHTPSIFTAHLQSLATGLLCGICRRSSYAVNMIERKIYRIKTHPFWKTMLELQMKDRFSTPEKIMKAANEQRLEQHITLRRLYRLKSIIVDYTTEAKKIYQTRLASWNNNSVTGSASFMESQIHPSFLNSQYGLNVGACRNQGARLTTPRTSFINNFSYPIQRFPNRGRGSSFRPAFDWQRFLHVPRVPL